VKVPAWAVVKKIVWALAKEIAVPVVVMDAWVPVKVHVLPLAKEAVEDRVKTPVKLLVKDSVLAVVKELAKALVKPDAQVEHGRMFNYSSFQMIETKEVLIEKTNTWEEGKAKNITFIVTEDCQLQCKYCYLVGKNDLHKMDFETAKKSIDYLLQDRKYFTESSVILDFIGGEPFIEIDLIDQICDYFKIRAYETDHPSFNSYRFSFSTNGLLYNDPKVQKFITKNLSHLSIQITIDGTKEKHNLQRVYPSGKGSYDQVVKNIPLWISQFPNASTKVTISRDDLPYIKDSVLHLWQLGIKEVNINVVFEDVWETGDDAFFEEQLVALADEIIAHKYYEQYSCSFFSTHIGYPYKENMNWCGAGKMLAIDHECNFFPCNRFVNYSLQNREQLLIGDNQKGINQNRLRPFLTLDMFTQSSPECVSCEVATGCAWCQGANYDYADSSTIFQRATYLCLMHKARVRANNYFWNKLEKKLQKTLRTLS